MGYWSVGELIPVADISQSTTVKTQIFRAMSLTQVKNAQLRIFIPGSAKATAVLYVIRGANTLGTAGSAAIGTLVTSNGSTANPTNNITTTVNNELVLSFLGNVNTNAGISAGSGYAISGFATSSGGGAAGTKVTTSAEARSSLVATPSTVAVPWTLPANDWTKIDISIKP